MSERVNNERFLGAAFAKESAGYGLATLKILYRLPEYPDLLQTFVWQVYDVAPDYPRLAQFLDFWASRIDGAIHSVEVAHNRSVAASEVRAARALWQLN